MIGLETLSLSVALSLFLAFIAGSGFGVWLTLKALNRIYTQVSKPTVYSIHPSPPKPPLQP